MSDRTHLLLLYLPLDHSTDCVYSWASVAKANGGRPLKSFCRVQGSVDPIWCASILLQMTHLPDLRSLRASSATASGFRVGSWA